MRSHNGRRSSLQKGGDRSTIPAGGREAEHGRSALPPTTDREQSPAADTPPRGLGAFRPRADQVLVASALSLLAFGLVMVFSVSSAVGFFREDGDLNFYLRQQALVALAGLVFLVVLSRINYRWLRVLSLPAVVGACGLLLAVHVPGLGRSAGGASRWLDLGPFPLQPSEVAKLSVILVGAHLLATKRARSGSFEGLLWPFGAVVAVFCLLIVWQRDLGTALVVAVITMGLLWVAGMRARDWLGLAVGGAGLVLVAIFTEDYRRERFLAFLDPFGQAKDSGFQIVQSFLAMGSGGWSGVGPGLSVQKFSYLPEAHTDMILAVLGEELGLIGVGVVIGLFLVFGASGLALARRCADPFGRYLVAGCTFLVVGQAGINMGGVMGAIPLTGVPLPFISYGRTNLLVVLIAVGIMLSVARFGPVATPVAAHGGRLEPPNVTHIDSRRRHGGPRGARTGHR